MHWYLATLVFEIQTAENAVAQFDVQHKLFQAYSKEEAVIKANTKGTEEEVIFFSSYNKLIKWKFLGIKEIEEINLSDGVTLKQETYELVSEERSQFIKFVQTKHQEVQPILQDKGVS